MAVTVVPDNDVGGAVEAMRRVLESENWAEHTALVDVRFASFTDLGLAPDASDQTVWEKCQSAGAVLVTGNRAGGRGSLDQVIHQHSGPNSLPVITVADTQRIVRDSSYAERAALRLLNYLELLESLRGLINPTAAARRHGLNYLELLESLRGAGRLYVP